MEKLSKTARVLDKIIKVLRGLSIGFGIACAVLLVIGIFLPDSMYSRFVSAPDLSITFGHVQLHLHRALELDASIRLPVCANLLYGMVVLALSAYGLHLLHGILAPMAEAQPFHSAASNHLKKLAWLSLVGGLAASALSTLATFLEIRMYRLDELFAPGLVRGYTVTNVIDMSFLLIPALLFLLSYVFRYGEELQKLSDETL